jgi:hypothetical protein
MSVTVPKMRVYVNAFTPAEVHVHFTYLGSTGSQARLGSGELRRISSPDLSTPVPVLRSGDTHTIGARK